MTKMINFYSEQTLFSWAAYANLNSENEFDDNKNELKSSDCEFTEPQATAFLNQYSIEHQHTDSSSGLSNGSTAANGFAALKDLDSNGDGVFDIKDAAFTELVVWRDANGNKIAA